MADGTHTLVLKFAGAAGLTLEFLAQLIQQLRQTGVGSGHHPAMSVIHGDLVVLKAGVSTGIYT